MRAPDLVLVDGGKGQLNVAVEVLTELGAATCPWRASPNGMSTYTCLAGLSRWSCPCDSPALLLLEHVRDEAHRFCSVAPQDAPGQARHQLRASECARRGKETPGGVDEGLRLP